METNGARNVSQAFMQERIENSQGRGENGWVAIRKGNIFHFPLYACFHP